MTDLAAALAASSAVPAAGVVLGRVTAVSGRIATVALVDATLTLPCIRSYTTPLVDDVVVVARAAQSGWVLGALGTTAAAVPAGDPAPPPRPAAATSGTETFTASSSGTYRGSAWRSDTAGLYQGDWTGRGVNRGGAWYGRGPAALAGTATAATVRLHRLAGGSAAAQTPTLTLLAGTARPAGAPSVLRTAAGPAMSVGQVVEHELPLVWAQDLIDGVAGGIGCYVAGSSPYVHLAGRDTSSAAMRLRLSWAN